MKYYIIAGERSGDLHGGNLVKELKKQNPRAVLRGFGGDDMKEAGVELAVHYREMAFMGFLSLATSLFKIFRYIDRCKKDILQFQPDVVILIDYGGFNLKIAQFAKKKGIKNFYYITPKVWAWYQSRAWKLKAAVDRMFVILPFEKTFFKKYNWEVDYVGNPVLDAVKAFRPSPDFLAKHGLSSERKIVALLPGSRKIELKRMAPLMAEMAEVFKEVQFVVAAVNNLPPELYDPLRKLNVKFVIEETYDLLHHAHAAVVTSGTATLETGIFKVPQVVVYKTGRLEYRIVTWLVKVKFISLVNLIADKEVIKELIQEEASKEGVLVELKRLLYDDAYRTTIQSEYDDIYRQLDTGSASENTARLMTGYLKDF